MDKQNNTLGPIRTGELAQEINLSLKKKRERERERGEREILKIVREHLPQLSLLVYSPPLLLVYGLYSKYIRALPCHTSITAIPTYDACPHVWRKRYTCPVKVIWYRMVIVDDWITEMLKVPFVPFPVGAAVSSAHKKNGKHVQSEFCKSVNRLFTSICCIQINSQQSIRDKLSSGSFIIHVVVWHWIAMAI